MNSSSIDIFLCEDLSTAVLFLLLFDLISLVSFFAMQNSRLPIVVLVGVKLKTSSEISIEVFGGGREEIEGFAEGGIAGILGIVWFGVD